jgi:nitrile hydratase accessory protein
VANSKLDRLTGDAAVPRRNGELVFDEPWQSRAFGLAVGLAERGVFEWEEFRTRLIAAVRDGEGDPGVSPATLYYRQWLAALETLLVDKGLVQARDVDARAAEFAASERDEVF